MFSQSTLLTPWIFIVFMISLSRGAGNTTQGNSTTTATDGVSVRPHTHLDAGNTTSNQTVAMPMFVVENLSHEPCVLATLNVTIRVSYYVKTEKSKHKYIAFRDLYIPTHAEADGYCGENETSIILQWDNSSVNLNLTFLSHGTNNQHTNWTLEHITLGYNMSNEVLFPGALEKNYTTITANNLGLFNTRIGHSLECDKQVKTELGIDEKGAVFKFQYVKLATFNLTSTYFPTEIDECSIRGKSIRDEDIVVPLIIACSLSFVIIVVVVAYAISRKVQETRDQTQYKPMP